MGDESRKRFVWENATVIVEAGSLEEAVGMLEPLWPSDTSTHEVAPGVVVFAPGGDPIVDDIDPEPVCTCRPGLVERGGFSRGCPVHA